MSTFRNPVGPQPSSVYWRRRLVVGLGLLAVVVVIILIVVRPGAREYAPQSSNKPTTSSTNTAKPTEDATTGPTDGACDLSKVTLEATTDAASYDPGVNPKLSFTLKSLATEPCTISAGSDLQEYRITSGDELIWSSRDCQVDPQAAEIELKPGVPFGGPSIEWARTRTSLDGCEVPGEPVVAEGASYHLEVSIGDLTSTSTKQFLLY